VALHAPSVVAAVAGDAVRREVIDTTKCAQCHEFFEGHGGNRVFSAGSANVCVFCHVPNLTSSSRQIDLGHIEDSQNLKDMIHGIHASAFRDRDFEHWRNRSGGTYYNWSEVTFPRGASTGNCMLCHKDGTYELPLPANLLPTTVRTTGVADGQDADVPAVNAARASVPNATDWVNTPMGSSCFYCHTSRSAWAHMVTSGAQLSMPAVGSATYINRQNTATNAESCVVCHGPGKVADIKAVHNR
jgi:OmcA/MtrC family decaheme c-type cytochrome